MKSNLFLTLLTVLAFAGMSFTTIDTDKVVKSYSIDTEASKVEWVARKVTGKHNGSINIKDGSLDFEEGVLKGGSFNIDMTTITVLDLQGKGKKNLEGHLSSADFFNVAEHNTANFTITKAIATDSKGNYKITGDLTIKGNTNQIKFYANVMEEEGKVVGVAEEIEVDRSEYDIRYGSGSFFENLGDKTIYDEFHLKVTLVAK